VAHRLNGEDILARVASALNRCRHQQAKKGVSEHDMIIMHPMPETATTKQT